MSIPAAWEDRFLSLLSQPGQWVTLAVSPSADTVRETKRRALYRSTLNGELDLRNVQHRIIQQQHDGQWAFQARWITQVDTPRYVSVRTSEGSYSEVMTAGSLLVTPGVVSQHSKRWSGDRNVIVFNASSTAHHNTMRWVLPREVAGYVRLSLNLLLGGDIERGSIVKLNGNPATGSE